MNLRELSHYLELTVNKKITIDQIENIFNKFYRDDFDYELFKNKYGDLVDKIDLFNEDLSRFEPLENLRKEYPNYYINKNQLMEIVKKFKTDIDKKISGLVI